MIDCLEVRAAMIIPAETVQVQTGRDFCAFDIMTAGNGERAKKHVLFAIERNEANRAPWRWFDEKLACVHIDSVTAARGTESIAESSETLTMLSA